MYHIARHSSPEGSENLKSVLDEIKLWLGRQFLGNRRYTACDWEMESLVEPYFDPLRTRSCIKSGCFRNRMKLWLPGAEPRLWGRSCWDCSGTSRQTAVTSCPIHTNSPFVIFAFIAVVLMQLINCRQINKNSDWQLLSQDICNDRAAALQLLDCSVLLLLPARVNILQRFIKAPSFFWCVT
jgi:hypothetical protein